MLAYECVRSAFESNKKPSVRLNLLKSDAKSRILRESADKI